jgi:hypothetical protein
MVRRAHSGRIADVKRIRSPPPTRNPGSHPLDVDRTDSRLDRPCRTVTVSHKTVPTVRKLQVLHRSEKRGGLDLDSLRKKSIHFEDDLSRCYKSGLRFQRRVDTKICAVPCYFVFISSWLRY